MIQKATAYFFLFFLFTACNSNENSSAKESTSTQATGITKVKDTALNYKIDTSKQVNTLLVKRDTLLTIDINNNKGSVRAYLSGIGRHVTIIVPVTGGDSLIAQIIPDDSAANIRFKQIYIPVGKQGKYDGPFSRQIRYPITVKGNYKLIVGEDLMAGDDWKGNFTCNVSIK
ncbi:MAG TPA: hypothetical protein VIJ92_17600 [Ginsengibacter sp.]